MPSLVPAGCSYDRAVHGTVRRLLGERDLRLVALTTGDLGHDRPLSWAAVTELPDPSPWLAGGELLLTTGVSWRPGGPDAEELVARVASVPVGAIGFGLGVAHDDVPAGLVDAAQRAGLPVLGVPLDLPFITLSQRVALWVLDAEHSSARSRLAMHETLADALLDGEGLSSIVRRLRTMVGAPVRVVDHQGRVLAADPWTDALSGESGAQSVEQVRVAGSPVAAVMTSADVDSALLRTAARLVGLELARVQAVHSGRRELLGQVLADVVDRVLGDDEAERRLKPHGVTLDGQVRLVLARVDVPAQRLRAVPWRSDAFVPDHRSGIVSALVDDVVALVLAPDVPAHEVAASMQAYLGALGGPVRVAVAGLHTGVAGLRMGWHEASRLLEKGPGTHTLDGQGLTHTLVAGGGAILHDRALELLRPVLAKDKDGTLLETLRVYLDCDCSPSVTSERLFVHRNTLRYRIRLVEQLSGLDLSRFADRMDAWVAVHALSETP